MTLQIISSTPLYEPRRGGGGQTYLVVLEVTRGLLSLVTGNGTDDGVFLALELDESVLRPKH